MILGCFYDVGSLRGYSWYMWKLNIFYVFYDIKGIM